MDAPAIRQGDTDNCRGDGWLDVFVASSIWPAGSCVTQQGDPGNTVYLLQDGFAKIVCGDGSGGEMIVAVKTAPTLVGVTAAVLGTHDTSTITTTRCRLAYCPASSFLAATEADVRRRRFIQKLLSVEIRALTNRLLQMGLTSAEDRFLSLLQPQVDTNELLGRDATLPLKRCEMASFLGISPEHLSRIIGKLVRTGVVRQRGRHFLVDWQRATNCRHLSTSD